MQTNGDPNRVERAAGGARQRTSIGGDGVIFKDKSVDAVDERAEIEDGEGLDFEECNPVEQSIGLHAEGEVDLDADVVPSVADAAVNGGNR